MTLRNSYLPLLFLLSLSPFCHSQTIFVTSEEEIKKVPEQGIYEYGRPVFTQAAFSFPLAVNPDHGEPTGYEEEKESFFIPDGLSAHVGAGVHYRGWIGVGMNVGLDWKLNQKLVSAPVYASLFLNPHFNEYDSAFFQAGYGKAYALGRGDLHGVYQKYRIGFLSEGFLIFAEANLFGYGLNDIKEMGSLSFGISFLDLFGRD